jgi:beta-glucosidase-like glycosyl hydrolase/CubicO group peptidase (beta-lactamase class C family)
MLARLATAVTAVCATLAWSCARPVPPPPTPLPSAPVGLPDESWIASTLPQMTLEQRVGQMLMLRLPGGFENLRGAGMRETERYIVEAGVGGFLVGPGSPADLALKLNELQNRSPVPLLFAAELDWSAPTHVDGRAGQSIAPEYGGTVFPVSMGIAATGDPSLAELAGRIAAAEARAVGLHWLLAPAVDINTAPDNPFVNVRSYGNDPVLVGMYAAAFVRGATAGGVLTTAKHFPGHGDTRIDSHVGLPVVNVDVATLEQRELRPFRSAIQANVPAIMLGHIAVPALTGGMLVPASLAPQIGTELLRRRLQFDGLVITDALTMGALREVAGYSPGELAVRAVQAGADIVLAPPEPLLAHRALVSAVRSGRIHYTRIDSSVVRILRAKARLGLHRDRSVALDSVSLIVGAPEHEIVAADIAARSLTLARDSGGYLPLDPRRIKKLNVIAFSEPSDTRAGLVLADELRRLYGRGVDFVRLDNDMVPAAFDSAIARAASTDATILATFLTPLPGHGKLIVPERARRLAGALRGAAQRMVVVSFGDPYGPSTLPGASSLLLAWQPRGQAAQRATARALAGRIPLPGRLPVDLPRSTVGSGIERGRVTFELGFARPQDVGMDSVLLARVDSIIRDGITAGAAPGAALAIGRYGKLVRLSGYGTLDRRPRFAAVTDSTIYDLASLTKVVGTTTAAMMLVDDGLLSLDDPVMKHLPEWGDAPARRRVTVRNLLLHNAGLPAYVPLWRELRGREQYRRRITSMSLEYEPGTRTLYSDFGPILVGFIIEQITGRTLDVFLRERLFEPLGMRETGFNPLEWPDGTLFLDTDAQGDMPDPRRARIAATEIDTVFRKRHIRAEVHDENAFALGGVAGHAGLFSSARDLALFAQLMLDGGFAGGRRLVDPATIELFTRRHDASHSRALGWDTPDGPGSAAGSFFSPRSFGHTGFTGTSLWIDPEDDLFVILLMNRVNPTRENQRHVHLRSVVADAVQMAITDRPIPRPLRIQY